MIIDPLQLMLKNGGIEIVGDNFSIGSIDK